MESKRTATTYFIPPGKFLLMENALGNPDLIQSSVSSDCRVTIVDSANFPLDDLEQWPTFRLTSADVKLKLGEGAYYIYIVVPTPENSDTTTAFISYNTALVNRNGYDAEGNLLGKTGFKYYQCGVISAQGGNSSAVTVPEGKGRLIEMDLGVTPAPSTLPGDLNDFDKIFQLDKVDSNNPASWLLTILTTIKTMTARIIRVTGSIIFGSGESEKAVTDVAVKAEVDEASKVSDTILASTAWVTATVEDRYLRKDKDDRSVGTISSDKGFEVGKFVAGASGAVIQVDKKTGQTIAELDKLYVRMKAYFETLEIINVNSVGGKMILSPAGAITCLGVDETEDAYRCYFLGEQDGEVVENRWQEGMQAYSQMFNAKEGVSNKVSNVYYWRLVTGVSKETVEYNNQKCHYIDLSKEDRDYNVNEAGEIIFDSDIPKAGDVINHRGARTDTDYMNFIEFSSVGTNAPYITLFQGVNSYSLEGKDYVQFGYDQSTGRAFMNVYGDMYVGARDGSSFIRYTPENGVEIKARLSVGSTLSDGRDIEEAINNATPQGYEKLVVKVDELGEDVDKFGTDLEAIKKQTDQEYVIWFENHEPTLENEPAVNWDTDELKELHNQDLLYYRDAGKAWRFEDKEWKEITDQDVLRALELVAAAQKGVDELGYLKRALEDAGETIIENGLVMTSLVAVRNEINEVEAFLNGSNIGKDDRYGKLLLAGGIPSKIGDSTSLKDRIPHAMTRIYEDGSIMSNTISFSSLQVNGLGQYILPPINGKYGMFYMDSVIGTSRSVVEKTFVSGNEESILRITGASSVSSGTQISISNQDTIVLFSCQDSEGNDMWSALVIPYWIHGREPSDSIANIQKVSTPEEATNPNVLYIITG